MSAARRSLPPAIAAGALLAGLWFVPTTHATAGLMAPAATAHSGAPERHGSAASDPSAASTASDASDASDASAATATGAGNAARPARDDAADSTRYVVGGVLVLGLGAGVTYARRRGRTSPA
ncbi:hypothetical protein [Streptomyces odontomachi]|uniref:hypothetical protein n=1 Tax=Streptomyces odontomachi TaxID=2944940 RepID=UPI00210ECB50|nr:hypothetical protein [Streptomyces sp. ODS25]